MTSQRRRLGDKFSHTDTEWMLTLQQPVAFLTRENMHKLEESPYMVGLKADGERMLLLCEEFTHHLYLISRSHPVRRLEGKDNGPFNEGGGYILDVEVIQIGNEFQMILAFDVLSTSETITANENSFKPFDRKLTTRPPEFGKRLALLDYLVQRLALPGLFVKETLPAGKYSRMKRMLDSPPYPAGGLIFTPYKRRAPVLKWKPATELTLDVALGGAINKKGLVTQFIAHLGGADECNYLVHSAKDVVPLDHLPIDFALPNDRFLIESNLIVKHKSLLEQSTSDVCCRHVIGCPCKSTIPRSDLLLEHCCHCGRLGVPNGDNFTCQIRCLGNTPFYLDSTRSWTVDIPAKYAPLAKHGIVEVYCKNVGSENMFLEFKRLRKDKKVANTLEVANIILEQIQDPLDLSLLRICRTGEYIQYRKTPQQSAFGNLRMNHLGIKGWLYCAFGGKRIIDVSAGSFHDMQNWERAGIENVLVVERNSACLPKCHTVAEKSTSPSLKPHIETVQGDLSSSLDLQHEAGFKGEFFNSIFCNFAIQCFWETPEQTATFLNNLSALLRDGGMFVVTYLKGEKLLEDGDISLFNPEGNLEFSARVLCDNASSAEVYFSSIGTSCLESMVCLDEMKSRFSVAGYRLVAALSFEALGNLISTTELTAVESKMSSLYGAAVFQKKSGMKRTPDQAFFVSPSFPNGLEFEFLKFLDIPDLVACRSVCRYWNETLEQFQIEDTVKIPYFIDHQVKFDKSLQSYSNWYSSDVAPLGLALYLHMGGTVIENEESESDDVSSYYDSDDEPDLWQLWLHSW